MSKVSDRAKVEEILDLYSRVASHCPQIIRVERRDLRRIIGAGFRHSFENKDNTDYYMPVILAVFLCLTGPLVVYWQYQYVSQLVEVLVLKQYLQVGGAHLKVALGSAALAIFASILYTGTPIIHRINPHLFPDKFFPPPWGEVRISSPRFVLFAILLNYVTILIGLLCSIWLEILHDDILKSALTFWLMLPAPIIFTIPAVVFIYLYFLLSPASRLRVLDLAGSAHPGFAIWYLLRLVEKIPANTFAAGISEGERRRLIREINSVGDVLLGMSLVHKGHNSSAAYYRKRFEEASEAFRSLRGLVLLPTSGGYWRRSKQSSQKLAKDLPRIIRSERPHIHLQSRQVWQPILIGGGGPTDRYSNYLINSPYLWLRAMSMAAKAGSGEHPYGWIIVAVSTVCLALGFGAGATVSVLMKPFEQEFGWSRADISMAYTMHTIGAAFGGLLWGALSDRIGVRRVAFIGAATISAGLIGLKWQSDLTVLYVLFFLLGAVGFACLFAPIVALTGLWFNARKGLAIGIVTAGGAIGQGIVPYGTELLMAGSGWRDAMLYLGIAYFVILFPLMFLLRPAPAAGGPSHQAVGSDDNLWNVPHAITIPWLALAGFFCCVCMAVPLVHLVPLGIDAGCSPRTAAGLLLALMIAGVFGRLFFGWLADRVGGLLAYFLASLAQTAVVFWFTQTRDVATLFQLSVLFGFGFAGVMTCLLICAREAAPARLAGSSMAIVSTAGWIGMGLGSYQAGYFYDITASYLLSYANAAIGGIVNLLIVAALFWYRHHRTMRRAAPLASV